MHVDGFRFDLASALAREFHAVDRLAAFFDLVNQDPVVSQVKLIAEPWDVGEGGYQVGGFPPLWTEWNGRYRDTVRDFWRGEPAQPRGVRVAVHRLARTCTRPTAAGRIASINFVTAHDGFTLHDLVSYNDKHNEANGEDNRGRGEPQPVVEPRRGGADRRRRGRTRCGERQKRNFLATLLLSQGVPMISHGDELGRTQGGNNNVYAQDNEISWVDWDDARDNDVLTEFTARLAALRAAHPVFRRQRFFQGRPIRGSSIDDIAWLRPDGQQMTDEDWNGGHAQSLAIFLNGRGIPDRDEVGERVVDDSFLLLINAHHQQVTFTLPGCGLRARPGRSSSTPRTRCSPTPGAGPPGPVIDSDSWAGRCACCDGRTDAATPFVDREAPVPPVRWCARRRGGRIREFLNGQQRHREQGVSDSGHDQPMRHRISGRARRPPATAVTGLAFSADGTGSLRPSRSPSCRWTRTGSGSGSLLHQACCCGTST